MDINIAINEDYFLCRDWFRLGQPTTVVESISYTVTEDLATEPIDVPFLKKQSRIDFNTDDQLLTSYIKAARQYLEGWSQLSFGPKTIRFMALKLPNKWDLVNGPYVSIDTAGTTFRLFGQTLIKGTTAGNYRGRFRDELYEVDLTLTTGWPNDELPEAIKIAIAKQAAWLYISRESLVTSDEGAIQHHEILDDEAQKFLQPYRNITFP